MIPPAMKECLISWYSCLTIVRLRAGWEGSKAAPRAQHPQHVQHAQHASAAAAASHRCLSTVTRCLWHCEYFMQGLLSAPPGQLQQNAVLPALAEVLRAWGRADDKAPNRVVQEQLAGAMSMLQDVLASAFPQLFKQGDTLDCAAGIFICMVKLHKLITCIRAVHGPKLIVWRWTHLPMLRSWAMHARH